MSIFPNLRLWRRSLCSNLGGIDPEKLYRATLSLLKVKTQDIREFLLALKKQNHLSVCTMSRTVQYII